MDDQAAPGAIAPAQGPLTPEQVDKIRALIDEHDLDFSLTKLEPDEEQQFLRDIKNLNVDYYLAMCQANEIERQAAE